MPATQTASAMLKALAEHEAAQHEFTIAYALPGGLTWYFTEPHVTRWSTDVRIVQTRSQLSRDGSLSVAEQLVLVLRPGVRVKRFLQQPRHQLADFKALLVQASQYDKLKALAKVLRPNKKII